MNSNIYKRIHVIASLWLSVITAILFLIAIKTNIISLYWVGGAIATILLAINVLYLLNGIGAFNRISSEVGEKAPR